MQVFVKITYMYNILKNYSTFWEYTVRVKYNEGLLTIAYKCVTTLYDQLNPIESCHTSCFNFQILILEDHTMLKCRNRATDGTLEKQMSQNKKNML